MGEAGGIGLGMPKAFLRAGMKVTIADLRREQLDQAMAQFGGNSNIHAIQLNVTDREAMKRAADKVEWAVLCSYFESQPGFEQK